MFKLKGFEEPLLSEKSARTLHIYCEGSFSKVYHIRDSDDATILYTIEMHHVDKPQVRIYLPQSSEQQAAKEKPVPFSTAKFRHFLKSITVEVNGEKLTMDSNGALQNGHNWESPALGGRLITWAVNDHGLLTSDRTCFVDDDKDNKIALWEAAGIGQLKVGKLLILEESMAELGSPIFNELLICSVADMEYARRRSSADASTGHA